MPHSRRCVSETAAWSSGWLSIMILKLHLSGYEDHSAKFRNAEGTSYILEPALPFTKISADRSKLW